MGPTAVEENVWSRNRIVTSVMPAPRIANQKADGAITYVQWHICHLGSRLKGIYSLFIIRNHQETFHRKGEFE
jgi:hypothetical protein